MSAACKEFADTPEGKKCGAFSCVVLTIVSIILFVTSWGYVGELQYCFSYSLITNELSSEIVEPGAYLISFGNGFLCFPSHRQRMECSPSGNQPRLQARTKEGLPIQMDLSVEYQLRKSEIFDLFGKVTTNFEPFLHDLMLSTLRNTASRYEALDFLSNERKHIADMMLKDLNATVGKYHADALDIQLFHVDLPSRFESWIEEIENIKLNQQRELEERKVELAQEGNTLVKQTIELDAAKQEMLIDAAAEVKKAEIQRQGSKTTAEISALKIQKAAERDRVVMEIQLDAKKRLIELYRLGNLTKAKNYQAARIVQHKTAIVKATGESEVAVLEAETLALQRVAAAKGAAEALKQKRRGQKELLKALIEGAGATPEQALRFMWVQAHKQFDNSQTFVDYKKVPMLMESSE